MKRMITSSWILEVPGIREEDLKLTLEGNAPTISGERELGKDRKQDRYQRVERYYGQFSRTFTLPATVNPDSVEAKYENGILHVIMAKKAEAKPRLISKPSPCSCRGPISL
ncbi:MAG: Hsp20/alpha crystallin family protein [Acidobacteriaceae bacterium]